MQSSLWRPKITVKLIGDDLSRILITTAKFGLKFYPNIVLNVFKIESEGRQSYRYMGYFDIQFKAKQK